MTFLFLHTSILQFKYCTSKGNNDPCLFAYAINYTKNNLKKSIQVPQTVTTTVADASNFLLQLVVKVAKKIYSFKKLLTSSNVDFQYTTAFFQTSRHAPKNKL